MGNSSCWFWHRSTVQGVDEEIATISFSEDEVDMAAIRNPNRQ
jgi:hypothetical protein